MVDIDSHRVSVEGIPKSLDLLYQEKSVSRICIFDCFAVNKVMDYQLQGEWNNMRWPSELIFESRKAQLNDMTVVNQLLCEGEKMLNNLYDMEMIRQARLAFDGLKQACQRDPNVPHC